MRMRQAILRGLCVVTLLPMGVSCVSYGAYSGLQDELERTQAANRHLVDQYNRAVLDGKINKGGTTIDGIDPQTYQDLQARFAELSRNYEQLKNEQVRIDEGEVNKIDGAEYEDGGIRLGAGLLFNSGESKLKSTQLAPLDGVADLLQREHPGEMILVEGHTDTDPLKSTLGTYRFNLNLGYQRAYNVFQYLLKKHGFPESRFRIESYGFTKPLDPSTANTKEGKRKNRRVVIRVAGKQY